MRLSIATVALLSLMPFSVSAQELKVGKWQTTITTEMPSMPGMPRGSRTPNTHTMEYCVTEADKDKSFIKADNCTFSDRKASGNSLSWKMTCGPEPKMSGEITIVISGETYTGNSSLVMEIEDMPKMNIKGTYKGKYLGNC